MIIACLVLVSVAVLLFLAPPVGRQLAERLDHDHAAPRAGASRGLGRWWWLLALIGTLASLWAAYSLAGPSGAVVAVAALIILATAVRLGRQHVRFRSAVRARTDVAHACSVLASQIRVGRVASDALRSAADDSPVLARAQAAQSMGGDVTEGWRRLSAQPGHGGLADLARAWQVSSETGAPLARSLEQVSEALTADHALRLVVAGELAAPRATGKIMAALPFCGLGLGYLIGGRPIQFLLSGPLGWGCLVLGVALAAAGVLWIDQLAQRATEQG